jgi:inosine triphosphate pyrophosphatase
LLLFATGNDNKFTEASRVLGELERLNIDTIEPQTLDLVEITQAKVDQIKQHTTKPFFCEDVSLFIDDINGFPGPFVKYFLKQLGADLIAQYFYASPARSVCTVGYFDGQTTHILQGVTHGRIVVPRGEGWGFNAIFEEEETQKTLAELHEKRVYAYTHRTRALEKLKELL